MESDENVLNDADLSQNAPIALNESGPSDLKDSIAHKNDDRVSARKDQHVLAPADIFTPSDQIIMVSDLNASKENAFHN